LLERRIGIAAALNRHPVVDHNRGFDPADLKACLTKRVLAQLKPA
jgi:hypothetical protein